MLLGNKHCRQWKNNLLDIIVDTGNGLMEVVMEKHR